MLVESLAPPSASVRSHQDKTQHSTGSARSASVPLWRTDHLGLASSYLFPTSPRASAIFV